MTNVIRIVFAKRQRDARDSVRFFVTLWFIFILVIGTLANFTAHSTYTVAPYAVTISTSNFRIPMLAINADDLSDPGNTRISLQNGTSLWYGISITSTPGGIVPTVANPTNDLVTATFLGSIPLLPPAQVLPFDQWNGSYHFETLNLKTVFSGPGQQIQLVLAPTEQHAVTLDVLTLLLQLLGQKQSTVQIGLLEPGVLQDVFTELGAINDFSSLVANYEQALTSTQNATLPYAYACAQNIASLLADSDEQSALADVLWKVEGKAISRESISKTIASFAQTQFGLAIEGFVNNEVSTMVGMFSPQGNPTVQLQTISTVTPSVTPSMSATSKPTHVPTKPPTPTPTRVPTYPPATPTAANVVGGRFITPAMSPTVQTTPIR